jgi:membrane protein DedA with SNARE-associated domain
MFETNALLEWITNTITSLGYWGIGLLMFLENVFPPIPSELIMPLAGFTVTQGKLKLGYVILAGILGSMLGTLPWYYAGMYLGNKRLHALADRYGQWLTISGQEIDKANHWFNRHGGKTMFLGRLLPGVRSLISIPAGIARMLLLPFLVYSTAGTTLWVALLTLSGYVLGRNYHIVERVIGPVSTIVAIALALAFGIWWIKRKQKIKGRR